eukprot:752901-Hanusia_phi.AAC.2
MRAAAAVAGTRRTTDGWPARPGLRRRDSDGDLSPGAGPGPESRVVKFGAAVQDSGSPTESQGRQALPGLSLGIR